MCEAPAYVTIIKLSVEMLIRTLSAEPILQTMMTFPRFMAMSLVSQRRAVQTLHTCGLATSFYCTAVQLFLFAFALSHTISICPCRFHSPQFFSSHQPSQYSALMFTAKTANHLCAG